MNGKLWAVTAKNSKSRGWTSNVRRKIFLWWPTNRQLLRARLRRAAHTHLLLPWNGGVRNETRRNTEAKTSAAQEATLNSSRCRSTHETLRAHANAHWTSCLGMFGGPDARKWTRALALVSQMKRNPRHPRLVRISEKKNTVWSNNENADWTRLTKQRVPPHGRFRKPSRVGVNKFRGTSI